MRLASEIFCFLVTLIRWQSVKSLGVAIAHGVFVVRAQPGIFIQFIKLGFAGVVIDLVRKIRREDERLVADDTHREGQR